MQSDDDETWSPSVLDQDSSKNAKPRKSQNRKSPNVSHWLWDRLQDPKCKKIIEFTNVEHGEFRIVDQHALAKLWGCRPGKSNKKMNYRDLARTMRYHYKRSKGRELEAVNRHLVYRFSHEFLSRNKKCTY